MRIKSTAWAKKFKRECPLQYDEAIAYATELNLRVVLLRILFLYSDSSR